ncbi:MAG: ATP-binding cassette domain-containing protein [Pseudomonadota bacterium]
MLDHEPQGPAVVTEPSQTATGASASATLPIALHGVGLVINNTALLHDVDLRIAPGGVTAVLGANGAGKSLLLRVLHGLIAPTSGTIAWAGGRGAASARRAQAMVFQHPVLLRRSVAANIDFVLGGRGTRGAEACAWRDRALERVGLGGRQRDPARRLSGGEQQRLALARALVCEPELILLDEATAHLDPASATMIEEIVADIARAGTTVVFVTHDCAQARRLADDVVFLEAGKVCERTRAAGFFEQPSHPSARAFLDGRHTPRR